MESLKNEDEIFLATGQEEKKLEIALKRYFQLLPEEEKLRSRYGGYLSRRLRPAVQKLIQKGENRKLELLLKENPPSVMALDGFLELALFCKNQEAQILLLRMKREKGGFQGKDWEL